jgi:hypothetical protein
MREVIKKVYTFNELSPEAQDKAIQDHIEGIEWSFESELISEDFKYELEELGYPTDDVPWSLNHCQGDGVAFYGMVDVSVVAKRLLEPSEYEFLMDVRDEIRLEYDIIKNAYGYHYSHWNTMEVEMVLESYSDRLDFDDYGNDEEVDTELSEKVKNIAIKLHDLINDDVKDVSRKLEGSGYATIDYIQNEENVREYLSTESDNEYYENGKVFIG